jgi:KUP system potassium uptake protein
MTQKNTPASEAARVSGPSSFKYKLAFASIGVVFGDIGTSPLYAMREALHPVVNAGGDLRLAVLGVVSLLLWALILVVGLKYVVLLMRADNKGEGGILSLVVLVETLLKKKGGVVLALGIIGAAFFFGDAMITPAMSEPTSAEMLVTSSGAKMLFCQTFSQSTPKLVDFQMPPAWKRAR